MPKASRKTSFWPNDYMHRQDDADFLYDFILTKLKERARRGETRSFVLNVDGDWGRGKSYFLGGLSGYLKHKRHPVAEINAWRDDFAADPMIAIMAALDEASELYLDRKTGRAVMQSVTATGGKLLASLGKGVLNSALKRYTDHSLEEATALLFGEDGELDEAVGEVAGESADGLPRITDSIATERAADEVARFRQAREAILLFGRSIEKIAIEARKKRKKLPLFILIDELDRCRPSYAILLLERIKHIFLANDIVFIFGTNSKELAKAVGAIYGPQFDGVRYLKRFFDRSYSLPTPGIDELVSNWLMTHGMKPQKINIYPKIDVHSYLTYLFRLFDLDLRGVYQCLDIWESAQINWSYRLPLQAPVLFPLIVGLYLGLTPTLSEEFASHLTALQRQDIRSPLTDGKASWSWQEAFSSYLEVIRMPTDALGANIASRDRLVANAAHYALQERSVSETSVLLRYPDMLQAAGRIVLPSGIGSVPVA